MAPPPEIGTSRNLLLLLVGVFSHTSDACTVLAVTPEATRDGSTYVTHTDDAEGAGDPRPVRVHGKSFEQKISRPVYANVQTYETPTQIGQIPQVRRTYTFFRSSMYGMINEKQLVLGESTCSSIAPINFAKHVGNGGKALFGIQELTKIVLERCDSARCAVKTAGTLAEKYGFYQDADTPTGEAFAAGDPREVWLFHVLPDSTGASAIWAAARVPPGHAAVIANMFTIREMKLDDEANFLTSSNLEVHAEAAGWKRGTPLDFTAIFSAGEYNGKHYSGRRVWRALSLLGGNATFPAQYGDLRIDAPYPMSTTAAGKLDLEDVTRVLRDYYEGTPYDLTKGASAGPWGTPNRYGLAATGMGTWERPISIFRCDHSYVGQARHWLPDACGGTLWFGPHNPHGTVYVPFAIGMKRLPPEYVEWAAPFQFDRRGAFWAHSAVQSLAEARFAWIQPEARGLSKLLEAQGLIVQAAVDAKCAVNAQTLDVEAITVAYLTHASFVARRAWGLVEQILYRFADGYFHQGSSEPKSLGYPLAWLRSVGYPGQLPDAAEDAGLSPPIGPRLSTVSPPPDSVQGLEAWQVAAFKDEQNIGKEHIQALVPNFGFAWGLLFGTLLGAALSVAWLKRPTSAGASASDKDTLLDYRIYT